MARNTNLSKHILDCGWGMFRNMLEYKTNVVRVNPKYTSQTCNECGKKDAKSRISQSEFVCVNCGHIENADVNAAKNILGKGIAVNRKREAVDHFHSLVLAWLGTSAASPRRQFSGGSLRSTPSTQSSNFVATLQDRCVAKWPRCSGSGV